MTDEEIESLALTMAIIEYHRGPLRIKSSIRRAIDTYNRERWRLESEAHEARQAHQREANVLAATAK